MYVAKEEATAGAILFCHLAVFVRPLAGFQ
jgi:hypothetical protein